MSTSRASPKNVDEYISGFPRKIQAVLKRIRKVARKAAPEAEESISYRIPTLKLRRRPLIYFAAFKSHIGLYPITAALKEQFKPQLSRYEQLKGTLKVPHYQAVPYDLIGRIVKCRAREVANESKPHRRSQVKR